MRGRRPLGKASASERIRSSAASAPPNAVDSKRSIRAHKNAPSLAVSRSFVIVARGAPTASINAKPNSPPAGGFPARSSRLEYISPGQHILLFVPRIGALHASRCRIDRRRMTYFFILILVHSSTAFDQSTADHMRGTITGSGPMASLWLSFRRSAF